MSVDTTKLRESSEKVADAPPFATHPWLRPSWPEIPGVQALFTTRVNGVSQAPFDSLNLGDHVRDDPVHVQQNRQILTGAIAASSLGAHPVFMQQVHGCDVQRLTIQTPDGLAADACVADHVGPVCTVMVADCLPVLFAHRSARVVAAAHAGWRGLVGERGRGILEATFSNFVSLVQKQQALVATKSGAIVQGVGDIAANTQVWLGPCIGPAAFEVGDDVRAAFLSASSLAAECFAPANAPGKWWANLPGLARQRLQAMGLEHVYGNDGSASWCTVSQPAQFFSHRRDAAVLGSTGRMAACVWLEAVPNGHPT